MRKLSKSYTLKVWGGNVAVEFHSGITEDVEDDAARKEYPAIPARADLLARA